MKQTALDKLEELLAYRFPHSGKELTTIVLTRAEADNLLRLIVALQLKAEGK